MVYDGIVIGLVVGLLRAGFSNGLLALANLRIRGGIIFPILLVLQLLLFYLQSRTNFPQFDTGYVIMFFYVVGLVLLWLNRSEKGFRTIMVGVFLNFLVMLLNGGKMPVSLEAASFLEPEYVQMLMDGTVVSKHIMLDANTILPFLGDIIPLSPPYPRSQAISIGDIVMNVGIFIYIQHVMLAQKAAANLRKQQEILHTTSQNEGGNPV